MDLFYIVIIIIFVSVFILIKTKSINTLEAKTFLNGFKMTEDFKLIQDWGINEFPVVTGRRIMKALGGKQKVFIARGEKNNKNYFIIKTVTYAFIGFNINYLYLEEDSMNKIVFLIKSSENLQKSN